MKKGAVFCLVVVLLIISASAAEYKDINARQNVTIKHQAEEVWMSVNNEQDTGFKDYGVNFNRDSIDPDNNRWELFYLRKLNVAGDILEDNTALKSGDSVDIVSVRTGNVTKYISSIIGKDWLHADSYDNEGGKRYTFQIFKETDTPEEVIKCGDSVYFKEINQNSYLDIDFSGTDANSAHRGSKEVFQIYEGTGTCEKIVSVEEASCPASCTSNTDCDITTCDKKSICDAITKTCIAPVETALKKTRHTANDIQVNIDGRLYSLQDYIEGKTDSWGTSTHSEWHYARDIKIIVDEEVYTLQSYLEDRLIKWEKINHNSWEDASAINVAVSNVDIVLQDAIDDKNLFSRGGTDETKEGIVKQGDIITIKSVAAQKYLSINKEGASMEKGLNANKESVEGDNERFQISIEDSEELVGNKKVSFKSVSSDMNLNYLETTACSAIELTIPAYNLICMTRSTLSPLFQWIHANPDESGSEFNEKIARISGSAEDDKIRYGDTIAFDCNGYSCFETYTAYKYNPVERLPKENSKRIRFNFNKWKPSVKYIICDEEGNC